MTELNNGISVKDIRNYAEVRYRIDEEFSVKSYEVKDSIEFEQQILNNQAIVERVHEMRKTNEGDVVVTSICDEILGNTKHSGGKPSHV